MSRPSRRRRVRTALAALLASCAAAAVPWAPSYGASDSFIICGRRYDAAGEHAWGKVSERHRADLADGLYLDVFDKVMEEFLHSAQQADRGLSERFARGAGRIEATFPGGCPDLDIFKDEGPEGLGPTRHLLFRSFPDEAIRLDEDCDDAALVDQMDEIRYFANALKRLCDEALKDPSAAAADRIRHVEGIYDRFLFEGYPMFPWEALVNGAFVDPDHVLPGPPRNLLVLFHPTLGVVASTRTFSDAEPDPALGIDLIGWVHYSGRSEYRNWWGVSAAATVASDRGLGLGASFQWDNFRVAVTYDDGDLDGRILDDGFSIYLGMDLYKLVKEKHRQYEGYRAEVREAVREYVEKVSAAPAP